jgi:hypothetical protein
MWQIRILVVNIIESLGQREPRMVANEMEVEGYGL